MADTTTVYASGYIYWAKIFGKPGMNYEKDGREWTYEFEPDDVGFLKEARLLDRLKDKYEDRGPYLTLKKPEYTRDGEKNEPIRVYDENDEAWDPNKLIGNKSRVDVKLRIVDYGKGKKAGIYTTAIRVTELVPYVSNEFSGMGKAAPAKEAGKAAKPKTKTPAELMDDLDEDIPF